MKKTLPYLLACLALTLFMAPRANAQTTILFESFENTESFLTNWQVGSFWEDDDEAVLWGVVDREFGAVNNTRTGTNKLYCAGTRVNGLPGWTGTYNRPYYPDDVWNFISRDVDLQGYKAATLTLWYHNKIFAGNDDEFEEECEQIAEIGNNKGCMELKGANPGHVGGAQPDRWGLSNDHRLVAEKWGVQPEKDLVCTHKPA